MGQWLWMEVRRHLHASTALPSGSSFWFQYSRPQCPYWHCRRKRKFHACWELNHNSSIIQGVTVGTDVSDVITRDLRLPLRWKWDICSSGMLRGSSYPCFVATLFLVQRSSITLKTGRIVCTETSVSANTRCVTSYESETVDVISVLTMELHITRRIVFWTRYLTQWLRKAVPVRPNWRPTKFFTCRRNYIQFPSRSAFLFLEHQVMDWVQINRLNLAETGHLSVPDLLHECYSDW